MLSTAKIIHSQNNDILWLLNKDIKIEINSTGTNISNENHNLSFMPESTVLIQDSIGNLLFYSDGINVWNKMHDKVEGSSDIISNKSTTRQGCTVIQSRVDKNKYFLLSLDDNSSKGELICSTIDFNTNKLGKIINTFVVKDNLTEGMVICHNPCGGIWIIVHERGNEIYTSLHFEEGKILKSWSSKIGVDFSSFKRVFHLLKISKNNVLFSITFDGVYELFKFNPYDGTISNMLLFENNGNGGDAYLSASFSGNGNLLYVQKGNNNESWIEQYDVSDYEISAIKASKVNIGKIPLTTFTYIHATDLSLANDDKIYFVSPFINHNIGVIEEPDTKGVACNFNPNKIYSPFYLNTKAIPKSKILPSIQIKNFLPIDTTICNNVDLILKPKIIDFDSLKWSNGSKANSIIISKPGVYGLELYNNGCLYLDTIEIFQKPELILNLGPDQWLCNAESHPISLNVSNDDKILWNDGYTQPNRILFTPGTYAVSVTSQDGCKVYDSLTIYRSFKKILKTTTIELCKSDTFTYKSKKYIAGDMIIDSIQAITGCDTLWNIKLQLSAIPQIFKDTLTCDNAPFVLSNVTYHVGDTIHQTKFNSLGCDTIMHLIYRKYINHFKGVEILDTFVCKDMLVPVTVKDTSLSYILWSNGENSSNTMLGAGMHYVKTIDSKGCMNYKSFEIKQYPLIQYEIVETDPICLQENGGIMVINKNIDLPFISTINNIRTDNQQNLTSGRYNILLTDSFGCITKDSSILIDLQDFEITIPNELNTSIRHMVRFPYGVSGSQIEKISCDPNVDLSWTSDSIVMQNILDDKYEITFIAENGCLVKKTLYINNLKTNFSQMLPNILSLQSSDAENTLFYLKNHGVVYDLSIFNRWGNLIYQTKNNISGDQSQAWRPNSNSTLPGVYVYLIAIHSNQGLSYFYGSVTVI